MKRFHRILFGMVIGTVLLASALLTSGCAGGSSGATRTYIHYGAGYRGFYRRPWGYPPIHIGGGEVDPDWGVDLPREPIAVPLPDMGMPDIDMMDLGAFDW